MAYDGKIMRRALQQFEEDRRTREERFQARRESIFRRQPRLRDIDRELKATPCATARTPARRWRCCGRKTSVFRRKSASC